MASSSNSTCEHRRYWVLNHHVPEGDRLGYMGKFPSASELWRSLRLQNSSLDLILGIQPGGASFLLADPDELNLDLRRAGRRPIPGCHFLSLSPIQFRNVNELEAKLAGYHPMKKATKKVKGLASPPPNSLNFLPSMSNKLDYLTNAGTNDNTGPDRAAFEQNRLLHHLLVGRAEPYRYCLTKQNSFGRVRLLALAVNYAMVDDPASTILDVAWQTIRVEQGKDLKPDGIRYYQVEENRMLTKQDCLGGGTQAPSERQESKMTTQVVQLREIEAALRAELRYDGPTILICWSWKRELAALLRKAFDLLVDDWHKNLDGLLGFGVECRDWRKEAGLETERQARQSHVARDPRSRPRVSRSQSPNRGGTCKQRHQEDRSVYVVDLQVMYDTMRGLRYPPMHKIAMELGLPAEKGWCARNECWLIFQAWKSLASGAAIDERCRAILQTLNLPPVVEAAPESSTPTKPVKKGGLFEEESEDEQDTTGENSKKMEKKSPKLATGHDDYGDIHKRYTEDNSDSGCD